MPSKELIEKEAREICDDIGADYDEHPSYWNNFAEIAATTNRAALEPTEGMKRKGIMYTVFPSQCWRAMLAASALGEQSDG